MKKYEQQLQDVETYSPKKLADWYDRICNVYAQRLCEMYEWDFNDCWWVGDEPGDIFCSSGMEYALSMEDIRILVDKCIPYEVFHEYHSYNVLIGYAKSNNPEDGRYHYVNLSSWLKDCPVISPVELSEQERIYWERYTAEINEANHILNEDKITPEAIKEILKDE